MRRLVSPILVGLGVFVLIAVALVKFYAYPRVAVAPLDQNSVTSLSATDAVIFDTNPSVLDETVTDLDVKSTTRGDVEASRKASEDLGEEVRVWLGTQTITDAEGVVRSQSRDSTAFNAHTSKAIDCCDNFSESAADVRTAVEREGIVIKFPFATEKTTYEWWDGTLGDTVDMKFVEETDIDGLTVYKFEGEVPETVVGTRDVPASVVGERGSGNVTADRAYANSRVFWVEPHTGVIIDRTEDQRSTLQIDGEERVIMTEANLGYTDAQVKTNVDDTKGKARALGILDGALPWLLMLLGLLLAVGGVLLGRSRKASRPTGHKADRHDHEVSAV